MLIGILGGGESGVGAAILAAKNGFDVFLSDINLIESKYKEELKSVGVDFEEGQHSFDKLKKAKWVVKSPGIPSSAKVVLDLVNCNVNVISEIEWAFRFDKSMLIAITGTNGKTTTTGLLAHILCVAGYDVAAVGNIGDGYSRRVASNDDYFLVCEVSSFQLDNIVDFKPAISIILNISPDHLDRYFGFEEYANSKLNIAKNQNDNDVLIYIDKDGLKERVEERELNCALESLSVVRSSDGVLNYAGNKYPIRNSCLLGPHNAENALACIAACRHLKISHELIIKGINSFVNEPHRLEYIGVADGKVFINDSKATNVDATEQALKSFDLPVIWIVGGVDKGNDYSKLKELVNQNVKVIIALGLDNEKLNLIYGNWGECYYETGSIEQAVKIAVESRKGDYVVLLSPACASFDLFDNYKDRGDQFKIEARKYFDE